MSSPEKHIQKSTLKRSFKVALIYSCCVLILTLVFQESIALMVEKFVASSGIWMHWEMTTAVFITFFICHLVNASSWMVLLQPPSSYCYKLNLQGAFVYSALINIMPIGTGHMLGIWFFNRFSKIRVKRLLVGWSIDQYMRGVIKVVALFLFFEFGQPFGEVGEKLGDALHYFGVLILLVAVLFPVLRKSSLGHRLMQKLGASLEDNIEGETMPPLKKLLSYALLLRGFCWVFEFTPLIIMAHYILEEASWELLIVLFLSVKVATAYSLSPGNFGVHEAVVYFVCKAIWHQLRAGD